MKGDRGRPAIAVLAAGMCTRMNSDLPKVLHRLGEKTLIECVLDVADQLGPIKIVVIVGHRRDLVQRALSGRNVEFVVQEPQLGTGHAVLQAESALNGVSETVLVLSGDVPLLRAETLTALTSSHRAAGAVATVLSTTAPDPTGYGRIVRDDSGYFVRITEERDATVNERAIREINSGVYCFGSKALFAALRQVRAENAKREYYLTDVIGILKREGGVVQAVDLAEFWEVRGINTPQELLEAEAAVGVGHAPERLDFYRRSS